MEPGTLLGLCAAAGLALVLLALLFRHFHGWRRHRRDRRHAKTALEAVRAAVAERLEHEKERPDRYPADHRVQSILQRARRRMHFDQVKPPPDDVLRRMVAEEIRRLQ